MTYRLHYAPDNASLIIRLALEEIGVPYSTHLVDRRQNAQRAPGYLKLNPNGLIPVLETPDGVLFETGAILLWLADRHGGLFPTLDDPRRGDALKWLFFLANTVHPALRMLFYADTYIGPDPKDHAQLRKTTRATLLRHFATLEDVWRAKSDGTTINDLYLAAMLRWVAVYPRACDKGWFDLSAYPALYRMAKSLESRPSVAVLQAAEGLGPTPFTAPQAPEPPEGSAT
jgi:glutathione S-transferase